MTTYTTTKETWTSSRGVNIIKSKHHMTTSKTAVLLLQGVAVMSTMLGFHSNKTSSGTAENAASTERSMWKVWGKCTEAEEVNRMLKRLVQARVGLSSVEAYSHGVAGRAKWANRGEVGRIQVVIEEMQSRVDDSNVKVTKLKRERKDKTNKYKGMVSHNIFRRKMSKVFSYCKSKRDKARKMHDNKVVGLVKKYGGEDDNFKLPDDVREYEKCKMFEKNIKVTPEDPSGPVIVCEENEEISLSECEWALLAKGPKYCIVRGCKEEDARVEIETCILKHKWDCMSNDDEEEDNANKSEEELQEESRVAQLAEEMAAQSRMVFDEEGNT